MVAGYEQLPGGFHMDIICRCLRGSSGRYTALSTEEEGVCHVLHG